MKRIILMLVCCTAIVCVSAQEATTETTGYKFSLRYFSSIPTGDFGDKDGGNEEAGIAESGRKITATFESKLSERSAFTVQGGLMSYPIDETALESFLELQTPGVGYQVSSEGYNAYAFSVGVALYTNNETVNLFVNPSMGYAALTNKALEAILVGPGGTGIYFSEDINSKGAIMLNLDIGVEVSLESNFYLDVVVGYSFARFNFDETEFTTNINGLVTIQQTPEYEQPYGAFNIGAGIGYRFN